MSHALSRTEWWLNDYRKIYYLIHIKFQSKVIQSTYSLFAVILKKGARNGKISSFHSESFISQNNFNQNEIRLINSNWTSLYLVINMYGTEWELKKACITYKTTSCNVRIFGCGFNRLNAWISLRLFTWSILVEKIR